MIRSSEQQPKATDSSVQTIVYKNEWIFLLLKEGYNLYMIGGQKIISALFQVLFEKKSFQKE